MMAKVFVGTFPAGVDATFVDGVDPAALMLREANATLDRAREAEARARQIATADAARAQNTRSARAARRFRRALTLVTRGAWR
jgi:hypothetical protein